MLIKLRKLLIRESFLVFIILCISAQTLFAQQSCGDWETYNEKKCFKVFDVLQSYRDAVNTCKQYNSTLVTISSVDEQHSIEKYLYTAKKIVDNVWVGIKPVNSKKYETDNNSEVNYTNWSEESPTNRSLFCVQLISDENNGKTVLRGKWSDVSCAKRNLALCQRMPAKTLHQLEDIILSSEIQLQRITKQIDLFFSNKWFYYKTFTENYTRKALIYPYKTESFVNRSQAIEICRDNNATLLDIESLEKQTIVQSFLFQISLEANYGWNVGFWLGGYSDSSVSDTILYKWMNSGKLFTYTNWSSSNEFGLRPYTSIKGLSYSDMSYRGKWYTELPNASNDVFCEITLNF